MQRYSSTPAEQLRPAVLPRWFSTTAAILVFLAACGDSTGPETRNSVVIAAGDAQFALPGDFVEDPLVVRAIDPVSQRPAAGVRVSWRVLQGTGVQVQPDGNTSDALGFAFAELRVGTDTGTVRIEATVDGLIGPAAVFTVRAVRAPTIASVQPALVTGGGTLTISGADFSPLAAENTVLFGGRRGAVTAASTTSLTVTVPGCVPTRTTEVRVQLGAVASSPAQVETVSAGVVPLNITHGQVVALTDPAAFSCLHLRTTPADAAYLLVAVNAQPAPGLGMPFELIGLGGNGPVTSPPAGRLRDHGSDWELALRRAERAYHFDPRRLPDRTAALAQEPQIGDRADFNVLNLQRTTDRVTAEVRAISQRAIIYVDVATPASGFTQDDLTRLGDIFDDPIYPTDVGTFGSPTDIDGNGRIIILFTPRVNALTPRNDDSFIAGFFYGCDLADARLCPQTNRAEIFYAMVPDPSGQFSGPRTKNTVLRTVPAVLAHEFQHMIHFGQKGRLDLLWLSEGLAHAAEDIVGDVFAARGDNANAVDFRQPNYNRAFAYLGEVATTSLMSEESPGSLELRGGAWLLIKHLMANYGGTSLLGELTRTSNLGTVNVATETGRPWADLLADFSVALWTAGAPDLQGAAIDPRHTFGTFNPRVALASVQGYPLQPQLASFDDFVRTGELPPGSADHVILVVQDPGAPDEYNVSFTGVRGGPFLGTPRFSVVRIR
jgi:hypothetical protein